MRDPDIAPAERARRVVQRHQAGEPLDPSDIDFMAGFLQRTLRAGSRPMSEAKSKLERRNSLVAAAAEVLYPDLTPSAAGRLLEALAREGTQNMGTRIPKGAEELLCRLSETGLPGPKQVENIIRNARMRNKQEMEFNSK